MEVCRQYYFNILSTISLEFPFRTKSGSVTGGRRKDLQGDALLAAYPYISLMNEYCILFDSV